MREGSGGRGQLQTAQARVPTAQTSTLGLCPRGTQMVPAASPPCGFVHAHPASHSPGGSGSWPLSSSWAWPATFPCGPWPVDALPPSLPAGSLGVVLCALGSTSFPLMRTQTSAQATLSSRASSEPISSAVSSDRPASGSPQCLGVRTSAFAFRRHTVHPVRGRSDSTWVRMLRREALSLRVVLLAHSQWPGSLVLSLPRDPRGRPPCTAHPGSQREGGAGDRGRNIPRFRPGGGALAGAVSPAAPAGGALSQMLRLHEVLATHPTHPATLLPP